MLVDLLIVVVEALVVGIEGFVIIILTRITIVIIGSCDGTVQLNSIVLKNSLVSMQMGHILTFQQATCIPYNG